jgi:hypothetical protein
MDRRKFCTSVAALSTSAVLPVVTTAAEETKPASTKSSVSDSASNLRLAMLSDETTRQFTTFNLGRKSKTIPVPRGHFKERLKFSFVNPWAPERLRPFAFSSAAFLYLDQPEGQCPPIATAKELLCWYRIRNTDHQSIP